MPATNEQIKKFINLLGGLCVNECNRRIAAGEGFILPSVALAQSALETGWGTAPIMTRANAFFGVKAGGSWTGKVYTADTWEVKDGVAYNTRANFRAYDSLEDGVKDYYQIMTGLTRYAKAVSYGADSTKWLTAKQTITALHAGGYATDELYVNKIMNTINGRDLTSVDKKIDGVTFLPSYDSLPDLTFKASDLLEGRLEITDSGRTISYVSGYANHLASDWANAGALASGYKLKITDPDNTIISVVAGGLTGETPQLTAYNDGAAIPPYDKFGFFIYYEEGLTIDDLKNVVISFESPAHITDAAELQKSALAFFVKIE